MKKIPLIEVKDHLGEQLSLVGWVQTVRHQKKIQFLVLRDRTHSIQCVVDESQAEAFETIKNLSEESVVRIEGLVVAEEQAKAGFEVRIQTLEVLSLAETQLPIPLRGPTAENTDQSLRMDFRWLDLRKPKHLLIFQVWTQLEQAFREYWIKHGFIQIHSPKLMAASSEGGAEFFEVKYFDRKAYLAQSPQFYKQMAMAAGFEKVFEIGPVFRAEPSFTPRHGTEFTGFDMELSFIDSHEDVMRIWEEMIAQAIASIKDQLGSSIQEHFGRELLVPSLPFPRVTMKEAKKLLAERSIPDERDGDLSPEEERQLSEIVKERYGHEFVFVTQYPASVRAFYHMRLESDEKLTKSFDLLWNGIEVTTGAQREHRFEKLKQQAIERGVNPESISDYLQFFRFGCPPHGGLGAGPGRMVMKILGLENIREASFLTRNVNRLTP